MKIAAIYSRVSSDKQKEEGTIASQTEALVEFAKNEGFEVPEEWIFQDDGYSGANLIRPGLERIRDLSAEGQIQAVLIYSPDRLSRKYAYQVLLIEELARQGVEAIFIKSPQSETPEGQLLLQFQGMIAEYERAQIQERTRRGKIHRAKQGQISALAGAPYGYRYIKKGDNIPAYYEIIESEAEIVRLVFDLYTVTGLSMRAICRRLEGLGYPSPKKNAHWNSSSIMKMLRNPAYKGTACFGKTFSTPRKKITRATRLVSGGISRYKSSHQVDSEKWIEIPVSPLINEETFAMAQELLKQNKEFSARRTIEPSVLQGLVYCQKCSYALRRSSKHQNSKQLYRYYRCKGAENWYHPGKKAICDQKPIRQDMLDDIVWSEVIKLIENPALIQAELNRRLEVAQSNSPIKRRQETLTLELTRVQKSMERLLNAYQEDLLPLDELRARLPKLRQKEKVLKTELQSVRAQSENDVAYLKLAETLSSFQSRLHTNAENLDILERQKIVRLLVREVLVSDDKITIRHSISGNHPFNGGKNTPSNSQSSPEKETANANHLLCSRSLGNRGGAMINYIFFKVVLGIQNTIYATQSKKPTNIMLSLVNRNSLSVKLSNQLFSPFAIGKGKSACALKEPITMRGNKKKIDLRACIHSCLLSFIFMMLLTTPGFSKTCTGRFVNPITNICWSCLFPITIGHVNISRSGREDTHNPHQIPCWCPRPPIPGLVPGVPMGFWEPARLVDVTRTPFCMVNMGGLQLGRSTVGFGVHGQKGGSTVQSSFYQVHFYVYPVIYWLELLVDFLCLEQQSFDVAYITELDPLWNADELAFILNPEAALFGNPIAQAACSADCAATSAGGPTSGFPMDALFWCGGCQGSLYPFTGNNTAHMGGVQASLLLTQRMRWPNSIGN